MLKKDISESELATLADDIEKGTTEIMKLYDEIREHVTSSAELRRKIDACDAVTKDIVRIVLERISAIGREFNEEDERHILRHLLAHDYVHSIYGTASQSRSSHHSESPSLAAKRAEAAAELAAKVVQYKSKQEEIKQKEKIRSMEEHYKGELEIQEAHLETLQAERERDVARARLEIYEREIKQESVHQPMQPSNQSIVNVHADPQCPYSERPAPHTDISSLAQAIPENILTNRLPIPTPTVFGGDPIYYIEWKASFQSLIDNKSISSADKLYYLKKYVSGKALKCIEGRGGIQRCMK